MSESQYIKKDDYTITIKEVIPEEIIPEKVLPDRDYNYTFLLKQRDDIQTQWDEQLVAKNKEIDEINQKRQEEKAFVEKLIVEAEKLGISESTVEPIIETEPEIT